MHDKILLRLLALFSVVFLYGLTSCSKPVEIAGSGKDWAIYLGDQFSSHYSTLSEINMENIEKLEFAWAYHTGDDISDNHSQIQCNPLIVDGILYGTSPKVKVFALNAATGERIWEFDPDPLDRFARNVNRGVSFWNDREDKRILFSSGAYLYELDAKTGQRIQKFGDHGRVSLKEGLGKRSDDLYVVATTPGIIYRDLLIIGSRVSENAGGAPGSIRAFNVRTGELQWVFNTIPRPGEFGYDTWPEGAWETAGGANSWAGMSLDEKRGIVFVPTGSAAFDFWGGNRKGANLFANCILALDAATGKRIWHYQTVHHDLWDRDLPAPPNLVTVTINGKNTDAVAQITKSGFVFLLDRETGKPLIPVEEQPCPASDLKGETSWPTQPIPLSPPAFIPQLFTQNEITNISPESHDYVAGILAGTRTGKLFNPPSTQGTVIFPGFDGGAEWGGAAVDPVHSVLYVNANIMPWILKMVELDQKAFSPSATGQYLYQVNCVVCHGAGLQGDPTGTYPSLLSVSKKYNSQSIIDLLNSGRGTMPSYKHLKKDEKKALAAFLLRQTTQAPLPSEEKENDPVAVPYTHTGYNRFLDKNGYPAVKPPWGTLTAIDLNKGSILWQVPLGEFPVLTAKGIPQTGTENYGGPVITAGGLLFIGASKDECFRAFDMRSGKELWKYHLPAGGYATPSVYMADGKEYVVIACGGGKMGTKSGDQYIAFTLGTSAE